MNRCVEALKLKRSWRSGPETIEMVWTRVYEYRMTKSVLMEEVIGRVWGIPRLGWINGVKVVLGSSGMTVENPAGSITMAGDIPYMYIYIYTYIHICIFLVLNGYYVCTTYNRLSLFIPEGE